VFLQGEKIFRLIHAIKLGRGQRTREKKVWKKS
jgi:hypothetical protein